MPEIDPWEEVEKTMSDLVGMWIEIGCFGGCILLVGIVAGSIVTAIVCVGL